MKRVLLLLLLGCGSKTGLLTPEPEPADATPPDMRVDSDSPRFDAGVDSGLDGGVFESCIVSAPAFLPTPTISTGVRLSGRPGEAPLLAYSTTDDSGRRVEVVPLTPNGERRGATVDLGPGQLRNMDHEWDADGHVLLYRRSIVGEPSVDVVVRVDRDGIELERVEIPERFGAALDVASGPTGVIVQTVFPEEEATRLHTLELGGWSMAREVAGRRTLGISTDRTFVGSGITWLATRDEGAIDIWEYFSGEPPFASRRVALAGRLTSGALEGATVALALEEDGARHVHIDGAFGDHLESIGDSAVVWIDAAETEEDLGAVMLLNDEGSLSIQVVLRGMFFEFRQTLGTGFTAPIEPQILGTGLVRGLDPDFLVAWPDFELPGVVVVGFSCVGFGGP